MTELKGGLCFVAVVRHVMDIINKNMLEDQTYYNLFGQDRLGFLE